MLMGFLYVLEFILRLISLFSGGSVVFKVMTREEITMLLCSTMPDSTVPCIIEVGSQYADCVFLKWPFSAGTYFVGAGLAFPGVHYIWMRDNLCSTGS